MIGLQIAYWSAWASLQRWNKYGLKSFTSDRFTNSTLVSMGLEDDKTRFSYLSNGLTARVKCARSLAMTSYF